MNLSFLLYFNIVIVMCWFEKEIIFYRNGYDKLNNLEPTINFTFESESNNPS